MPSSCRRPLPGWETCTHSSPQKTWEAHCPPGPQARSSARTKHLLRYQTPEETYKAAVLSEPCSVPVTCLEQCQARGKSPTCLSFPTISRRDSKDTEQECSTGA